MNARPHGNRLSPDNASAHENRARDFSPALRFCNFVDEYVADFWKELSRRPEASFRAAHHRGAAEYMTWGFLRQYLESARKRWRAIAKAQGDDAA